MKNVLLKDIFPIYDENHNPKILYAVQFVILKF